jgi:hypothetical protein
VNLVRGVDDLVDKTLIPKGDESRMSLGDDGGDDDDGDCDDDVVSPMGEVVYHVITVNLSRWDVEGATAVVEGHEVVFAVQSWDNIDLEILLECIVMIVNSKDKILYRRQR